MVGFKPQRIKRRMDGYDIGAGERKPGPIPPKTSYWIPSHPNPPKNPTEFPPILLFSLISESLLQASSLFPLLDLLASLRPYQPPNVVCTQLWVGVSSNQEHFIILFITHFLWEVCGVPDPVRGSWVAKFKHTWTQLSEHSSVGKWTARTNWSVHKLGDSRYCSDQSYKGRTPGEVMEHDMGKVSLWRWSWSWDTDGKWRE